MVVELGDSKLQFDRCCPCIVSIEVLDDLRRSSAWNRLGSQIFDKLCKLALDHRTLSEYITHDLSQDGQEQRVVLGSRVASPASKVQECLIPTNVRPVIGHCVSADVLCLGQPRHARGRATYFEKSQDKQ